MKCRGVWRGEAQTGLPKNQACLLIVPPCSRRGISGETGNRGDAPHEGYVWFNKKKQQAG